MSFDAERVEWRLSARIADLQVRVEHLESLLLSEADAAELEATAEPEMPPEAMAATSVQPETVAEPAASIEPLPNAGPRRKDLRTLQAEATAGFGEPRPTPAPQPEQPTIDLRFIEEQVAGRALALFGGVALLLGAVLFLSLAFSRGWISPSLQVGLGLAGGSAGLIIGGFLLIRGDRLVGHVLTAVGLAVISLSLFAATSLYGLIDTAIALAGTFTAAGAATIIAVRTRSQIVAGFGLVAALAAPPILGAEPEPLTLAYMIAALAGIAVISMWQTWSWLPPIAFLLSLPQLYLWIDTGPELMLGVGALLLYWALMTLAAGGVAFRERGHELSVTTAPLFLAAGASVIGLAFLLTKVPDQRAAFLLVLGLAHGLVTAFFLRRRGSLDPFGLLAGAYGIAIASAAVPLVLGATFTAVIWAIEGAVMAFLAGRRSHGPSLAAACALYAVAATSLAYEAFRLVPMGGLAIGATTDTLDAFLAGFVFFAAIGGALIAFVPARWFRYLVVGTVGLVALPVPYLALDRVVFVAAWVVIALITIGSPRWLARLPERRIEWQLGPALEWLRPRADLSPATSLLAAAAGAGAIGLATLATALELVAQDTLPGIPFTDQVGLSALLLAGGYVAIGVVCGGPDNLRRGVIAAGSVIGIVAITEVPAPWYVLVWAALATGAVGLSRIDDGGRLKYRYASLAALAMLALLAFAEAPPDRLVVQASGVEPHLFLVSDATLALGALAVALALVARVWTRWSARVAAAVAATAGVAALYLLSIGVVDVFAAEAHGLVGVGFTRVDELAKEAQVALSVLWTVVGVVTLGVGLVLRNASLRFAGLIVLTLATAKVFLIDLASLDVAYRVITLIVLGALLVASAYAWTRVRPSTATDREHGPRTRPPAPKDAHVGP